MVHVPLTIRTERDTTLSHCEDVYGPPVITRQADLVLVANLVGKAWGAFTVDNQWVIGEEDWEEEACGLHYSMQVQDPSTWKWESPADLQEALMERYLSHIYPAGSPAYDESMDWIRMEDALTVISG